MNHLKYKGLIGSKSGHPLSEWDSVQGNEAQLVDLTDYLRFSNPKLIIFQNRHYLLLLDGIIYEYDYQAYTIDLNDEIIEHLERDLDDTLCKLNGEFVLIFVKLLTKTIWICTSESGNAACFYRISEAGIHISNSLTEISNNIVDNKQIYFQRIYDILAGSNLGSQHTCFTEIKRLIPGQYMKVHAGKMNIYTYSKLFSMQQKREIHYSPYEMFRTLFKQAVGHRTNATNVGIALSSGKDSTAVAAMASIIKSSAVKDITGYTYYPSLLQEEQLSNKKYNETLLLKAFFELYPDVGSKFVVPGKNTVISSLEKSIEIYGEPIYGASNQYWIQEMHRMMIEDQCEIMLNGQGGNYTISWPPPELSHPGISSIRSAVRRFYSGSKKNRVLPYLSRDFLHSIQQDHFINRKQTRSMDQMQALFLENSIVYASYLQKQVSLYYGFHVSDPTLDKNIITYCLSLPYNVYHNKYESRRLITKGLQDLLPREIIENNTRSIQSADIQNRLQLEKDLVIEKLQFLNKNNLVTFVIDVGDIVKYCESTDFTMMKRKEINHLLRVILVGIFLSKI